MEGWNGWLVLEVNIRQGRRKKWGHPERLSLPTLREKGQAETRGQDRTGEELGRQSEAGGSWHPLLSHSLLLGRLAQGIGGSSALPRGTPRRGEIREKVDGNATFPLALLRLLPKPW